ncbi:hypothetical protein LX32DRAFT_697166 [Colletotrichum zoysiae]|uniref:Uncharacterized protein n=1 Tax=Colletotrichum zoysiae TaxID=1216348 RepID=A0AAD9HAK1_9PEZI|nr:hypothetical protein LX32DRAFT_697166 [Colletotrichum zoysiae]
MRLLQVIVLTLHAVAVVEAAKVSWTLHKSCYRNKEDTADDNELAEAIIKSVNEAKAWANRAASKIGDSLIPFLFTSKTKSALVHLVGNSNYRDNAKEVRARLKKMEDLEGPVGRNADRQGRYYKSQAWVDLESKDDHFNNFVIVCRPEIPMVESPSGGPFDVPYDEVRKKYLFASHVLQEFLAQEESEALGGDWEKIPPPRTMALTQLDIKEADGLPEGGRKRVPEAIYFHPLWIKFQRSRNFGGWSEDDFAEVTRFDALEEFKRRGAAQNPAVDVRPVDRLLSRSFTANVLHELFHLTYFGQMLDANSGAYGWANNVKNNDRQNPDLYAIIGAVIELRNRDGKKYSVSAAGEVSPTSS